MNRRHRQAKLARARAHQAQSRIARRDRPLGLSGVPPQPRRRRRALTKRAARAMGRKLRPERGY